MTTNVKPFSIHFSDGQISDLHRRIAAARFPGVLDETDWRHGTDAAYLRELVAYWVGGYDWRRKEKELNMHAQFICELDGVAVHFFHIKSGRADAVPLLLTHGWPDSFLRYAKVFPLLHDYDLIVPSLPGFAFSTLPPKGFLNNAEIAELWHRLMTDVLGYTSYVASGGDIGRGVTCYLATCHPEEVRGIHLTDVGLVRELIDGADETLSPSELDYKCKARKWQQMEGAYINIQGTKPQTLAYSLSDSPVGMAAWITEKYHAWSDWELLEMDDLLDSLTLYWLTDTGSTSVRIYHANTFTLPPMGRIAVPTAIAAFAYDVLPAPRDWIERNYPVKQYTEIPRGGHFTALEQPDAFAGSLVRFVESL